MYFMYVDETGDVGLNPGASDYFMLSGLVIHEGYWYQTLEAIVDMRNNMYSKYGFSQGDEMHAERLVGRSKGGRNGLTRHSALMMLRDVLRFEASFKYARSINVVVDKTRAMKGSDVFSIAWETIINRFEQTIRAGNFPSPWEHRPPSEKGFLIVDETNEEKLRTLVRTMRHNNVIPSHFGGYYRDNLSAIVEDPMHKRSDITLPIQLCDVNAYFLKQSIQPNTAIQKHKAKNYFYYLKPILVTQASRQNEYGIVFRNA